MKKLLASLIALGCVWGTCVAAADSTPAAPHSLRVVSASADYGEAGTYTLVSRSFENATWQVSQGGVPVTVLFPAERVDPAPVLFFSHAFGGTDWMGVRSLLTHLVSKGFVVVHSPYPTVGASVSERYQILWNGFQEAAERYAGQLNLDKVGFLGYSFGAGATPAMAWRGMMEKGWGEEAAFLFMMAPWYSYDISDAQLESFPRHVRMIIQVYDGDAINDHRMAMDIFSKMAIPESQKAYYNILEGRYTADHFVPSDLERNDLDRLAVRKPLDALMDCTFDLAAPQEGRRYALDGEGEHFQHTVTKRPVAVADGSAYQWPWSSLSNPRR